MAKTRFKWELCVEMIESEQRPFVHFFARILDLEKFQYTNNLEASRLSGKLSAFIALAYGYDIAERIDRLVFVNLKPEEFEDLRLLLHTHGTTCLRPKRAKFLETNIHYSTIKSFYFYADSAEELFQVFIEAFKSHCKHQSVLLNFTYEDVFI